MKHPLRIPILGEALVLAEPWTFTLYAENRNQKFACSLIEQGIVPAPPGLDLTRWWFLNPPPIIGKITLDAGTILKVARIYIRLGQKEFNSLTFNVNHKSSDGTKIKGRFWAKLDEVNQIVIQ